MKKKSTKSKPVVAKNEPIGVELKAREEYRWCSCGRSLSQPFCDDSCKDIDFNPLEFTAEEDGEAWLCRCKQTHDAPNCDGHHSRVSSDKIGQEFALDDYQYRFSGGTAGDSDTSSEEDNADSMADG